MGTDAEYHEQDSAKTTYNRPEITSFRGFRLVLMEYVVLGF